MLSNLYAPNGMMPWFGVVEDRNDPLFLGRCKVRIAGYHTPDLTLLPTADLPWAYPIQPINSAAMSGIGHAPIGPVEGTWVTGFFRDGDDCQEPIIWGTIGGIPQPQTASPGAPTVPSEGTQDDTTPEQTQAQQDESATTADAQASEAGVIGSLTSDDLQRMFMVLRERESSGNYRVVNPIGYAGAYQFGSDLLAGLGYLRPDAKKVYKSTPRTDFALICLQKGLISQSKYNSVPEQSRYYFNFFCLATDEVWTSKAGRSAAGFLANTDTQDRAVYEAFRANYNDLVSRRVLNNPDTRERTAGYLFVSHLLGIGGAMKLARGVNGADQNGTRATSYYRLGVNAINSNIAVAAVEQTTEKQEEAAPESADAPTSDITNSIDNPTNAGFGDASHTYPRKEYIGEPDTNRLARHQSISKTLVGRKDAERLTEVETANGQDPWDQPQVPYNAKYPYNHVFESESGHVMEFDDTPGNERVHLWHRSGTFMEWDLNGTSVRRVVGDDFQIIERNGHILIQGRANITVEGSCNIYVQNDCNLEVNGNLTTNVHKDYDLNVAGAIKVTAGKGLFVRSDDAVQMSSEKAFEVVSKDDVKIGGQGKVSVKSSTSSVALQGLTQVGVKAGAMFAVDALGLALLSGAAQPADDPQAPDNSPPVDARTPREPELKPLVIPSRSS